MTTLPQKLDLTFRIFILLMAMTVGVFFVIWGARSALAASLKPTALIDADVFTVGDLFSGLPEEKATRVLGPSPQPGRDMILNARTLLRISAALDLNWQPSSSMEQITVRRVATVVAADKIRKAVIEKLHDKGVDGPFEISFLNIPSPEMILPRDEEASVDITKINYDPQTGRFEVNMAAPSRHNPIAELDLAGKVERLVPLPILKRTLSAGSIIGAGDLDWIDVKESDLQSDTVVRAEDLLGMTPHRVIVAGKAIRGLDLDRPQLVSRGDIIMISYNDGPMYLTAQGKAMQNGAKGDLIRVVNTSSNRTIDAFVEDQSLVKVLP